MVFILYCLIMRTAYQAMHYEILSGDGRKNGIQTIEELLQSENWIYTDSETHRQIKDIPIWST